MVTAKILYNSTNNYTYDFDRKVTRCDCGFEMSDEALRTSTKAVIDKLTVHAIAHRLIDE